MLFRTTDCDTLSTKLIYLSSLVPTYTLRLLVCLDESMRRAHIYLPYLQAVESQVVKTHRATSYPQRTSVFYSHTTRIDRETDPSLLQSVDKVLCLLDFYGDQAANRDIPAPIPGTYCQYLNRTRRKVNPRFLNH